MSGNRKQFTMSYNRKDIVNDERDPSLLDIHQDVLKLVNPWLDIKSKGRFVKTGKIINHFFQTNVDNEAVTVVEEALHYAAFGQKNELDVLLTKRPGLVYKRGQTFDPSGRLVHGTVYQIALGAKDWNPFPEEPFEEMAEMIERHIRTLPNGEEEIELQKAEQFPEDWKEQERMREKRDSLELKKVFTAIAQSKRNMDCKDAIEQFIHYLYTPNKVTTGYHYNDKLLSEAEDLYLLNYKQFGGYDSRKNDLAAIKVIGSIQSRMTACLAMAHADGLGLIAEKKKQLSRQMTLYGIPFFNNGLGIFYFVHSNYDDAVRCEGEMCAGFIGSPAGGIKWLKKLILQKDQVASNGKVPHILKCATLYFPGMGSSTQTQLLKYTGGRVMTATTGEKMWCTGRNNLLPLNVIYSPHLGPEIKDVNLHPFDSFSAMFNPIKVIASSITWASNWRNGFHFISPPSANAESVAFHTPNLSQVNIGQEIDMDAHRKKYDSWLEKEGREEGLILWGVSRGTAATFCAHAKEKYPEVKLVVLEGAIDSVQAVISKRVSNIFKSDSVSTQVTGMINSGFSFFNRWNLIQYRQDGPSPLKSVADFPEGVPVVFITSKMDKEVPSTNTENIARSLADKGKNDVYLLILERSSHPNYMFDDLDDRNTYETFIHAIYKKYHLKHDPLLAKKGEKLIPECTLHEVAPQHTQHRMGI